MALVSYQDHGTSNLRFEPFADGSPPFLYLPMSDFELMENKLCSKLLVGDSEGVCE